MTDVPPEIESDEKLKLIVRSLTSYSENEDELPEPVLDAQVSAAKLRLKNKTGSTAWYSDDGLSQALLGYTCILAKNSVENYSVSSWTLGDEEIDVSGVREEDAPQYIFWNELIYEGLKSTEATTTSQNVGLRNTSSYIGE